MQVDAESFSHHLLRLLTDISEADLVSFDLELSGIPSRLQNKPAHNHGRSTLEARYAEAKAGADRYQILQVGITCARFDPIANSYVLRPYNIDISALLDERLDFERDICFQSGACSFLLKNNFDFAAPFASGVQYLSREEADRAQQLAWDRIDKTNPIEDLQLKDDDVESLDFVQRVREAVTKWKPNNSSYLEITSQTGLHAQFVPPSISRFEKRLVHQLIRAEFPDLVSVGRQNYMQIKEFDSFREAEYTRRQKNRVKDQIVRQIGFRWVFEALAQDANIQTADILQVLQSNTGRGMVSDVDDIKRRYDRAIERLKKKKPVLVGHNMFTDIVYFYRTFVGQLPDTLQEFNYAIHELFPRIVDTKYLATYAKGDLKSPTLQEIAEKLHKQKLPYIVTHADFTLYDGVEAFHEAGYDSLLTATIMLQLAAKLGAERKEQTSVPQDDIQFHKNNSSVAWSTSSTSGESPQFAESSTTKGRDTKKNVKAKELPGQKLHSKNIFETLRNIPMDPDTEPELEEESNLKSGAQTASGQEERQSEVAGSWVNDVFEQDTSSWVPIEQVQWQSMELIPPFDSEFWKEFGNKLRLFGTQEAVLKLADWEY